MRVKVLCQEWIVCQVLTDCYHVVVWHHVVTLHTILLKLQHLKKDVISLTGWESSPFRKQFDACEKHVVCTEATFSCNKQHNWLFAFGMNDSSQRQERSKLGLWTVWETEERQKFFLAAGSLCRTH